MTDHADRREQCRPFTVGEDVPDNLTSEQAAQALMDGQVIHLCGSGRLSAGPPAKAVIYQWICPWCHGPDAPFANERCLHCHGSKVTNDIGGWDKTDLVPAPRPPAVMRNPCVDCAYRPGSPEQDSGIAPGPETPFYCHHGLIRDGDGYITTATVGALPLGAMVCAGWWALATGDPLPEKAFRDPGGADRAADAQTS